MLTRLAELKLGLYSRPYVHQATALERFFAEESDLIVATGTGSGKTESFLMPIIADSDEAARVKRDDAARGYEMMPPTVTE
ncbi:MAG: DEAD/DEAH box helicase [Roseiarcus sp.]